MFAERLLAKVVLLFNSHVEDIAIKDAKVRPKASDPFRI
jgi:hypothetical protein